MEDKGITPGELKDAMAEDMERLFEQIAHAMNTAHDGRIIADSEEPVRDAHAEFRQRAYQKAVELLQAKQESFSPRPKGLRHKGKQATTHQTINGRIRIRRTIYWSSQGGTFVPADRWLGIHAHRFSPGVREMVCRQTMHCSFRVAAENLHRTAQLSLSSGTVRHVAQTQGRAVLAVQRSGALRPNFTAEDCTDKTLIGGTDGVMVPLVTEEQKASRRKTQAAKRRRRTRRGPARRGRPKRGSKSAYKEFKVLAFYDPDKQHCHVVGTAGNHEALGRLMRRMAGWLRVGEALVCYAVTDGAPWIARQCRIQLPMLDAHILDYYHLREHVRATSWVLYGEGTKKARQWCGMMMGVVWEQGSLVFLDRLGSYVRRHRSGEKHEALVSLRGYVGARVSMTDYPTFRALGYDCGSGPTESCCGTLTRRLKGPGMRWDSDNAEAMMSLTALHHSGQWREYWHQERTAA